MDKTGSSAFNEETRRELPKLTALVNPLVQDMPDIIGEFSSALFASPPLVTDRLHDLIEALAPGFCEYLEGPAIWDTVFEREIDRTAYRFVTVVKQVDTWDHTLSDITRMDRSDGSTWYSLGAAQVVDAKKAEGLHLWRDSVTKHVLVSEEFKRRVEAGGISNFYFREVQTNAAA